ncbi:MAG: hypothetical protein DBX55_06135 [Verrucomicrobia bacterium]|nr:MAG: hypothetical protein DBX55_06135 [Verrucomicrobiota bacterium]
MRAYAEKIPARNLRGRRIFAAANRGSFATSAWKVASKPLRGTKKFCAFLAVLKICAYSENPLRATPIVKYESRGILSHFNICAHYAAG